MTWGYTAVMAAVAVAGSVYSTSENKKAMKRAEEDAEEDKIKAAMHEKWSKVEGEGLGMLGEVKLNVDEDITDDAKLDLKAGKTTVRI